jgi:divalent metal cation (Fe/Co/Zn/Cd) transporter
MDFVNFSLNLMVCILVVTLAMLYLRRTTRSVIIELCGTRLAADFWLKSTDILAYSGALMLVLIFGHTRTDNLADSLRMSLILTLTGIFITVLFASRSIWKQIYRKTASAKPFPGDQA